MTNIKKFHRQTKCKVRSKY